MKHQINNAVKNSNTLSQVRDSLFSVFREYRRLGHSRIGNVSGIITSEGKKAMPSNIKRLTKFTGYLRKQQDFFRLFRH